MPELPPVFPAWQRGIRLLRLAFDTWYPWDQRKIEAKIRPLRFRRLEIEDIEWCLRLYNRNERFGVPGNGRADYEEYLESREHLVLIAEDNGVRLGTFGIHWSDEATGFISYLLVDPGAHRSGVGSTIVLAATTLLGFGLQEKYLMLNSFDEARPFYRSMAFVSIQTELHDRRPLHHLVLGPMPPLLIRDCFDMLVRNGVNPEDLKFRIPYSKPQSHPAAIEDPMDFHY